MRLIHRSVVVVLALVSVMLCPPPARATDSERLLLKQTAPMYPELAHQMRIGGVIVLELAVEADGHVSAAKIMSGHPLLGTAAQSAVKQWKYAPAAQASTVTVRVIFNTP